MKSVAVFLMLVFFAVNQLRRASQATRPLMCHKHAFALVAVPTAAAAVKTGLQLCTVYMRMLHKRFQGL